MKTDFKLIGLSKEQSATIQPLDNDVSFNVIIDMPPDRTKAMFDYCKGNWEQPKKSGQSRYL